MTAAGRWQEAEDALSTSLRLYDDGMRAMRSGAAVRLADLRVRQGRWTEAAVLLAGNEFDAQAVAAAGPAAPQPGRGGPGRRGPPPVARFRRDDGAARPGAGPAGGGARRRGRLDDARAVHERLAELAAGCALPHVGALAAQSAGVLARAAGEDALPYYESALRGFLRAGLPWEAARCRLAIARLRRRGHSRRSRWPRRGRRSTSSVSSAPGPTRTRPPPCCGPSASARPAFRHPGRPGTLTAREREVLALLVEGLSNQQIAAGCSSASAPWSTTSGASSPSSVSRRGPRRWPTPSATACTACRTRRAAAARTEPATSDEVTGSSARATL